MTLPARNSPRNKEFHRLAKGNLVRAGESLEIGLLLSAYLHMNVQQVMSSASSLGHKPNVNQ